MLAPDNDALPQLAAVLEQPLLTMSVVPSLPENNPWERVGSLAEISPASLKLLAIKPTQEGWLVRVQETAGLTTEPQFTWLGEKLQLTPVKPYNITTWHIAKTRKVTQHV
ncbi:MAG: hypothetical protein JKX85_16590 [Phycisphaeraceae bacterium]|nr:hypothetical protein [Phycisphaeraceae bacterium]